MTPSITTWRKPSKKRILYIGVSGWSVSEGTTLWLRVPLTNYFVFLVLQPQQPCLPVSFSKIREQLGMKLLARDKFEALSSPVTKEVQLPFKKVRTGLIQTGFGMVVFAMGIAWFLTIIITID